MKTFRDVKTVIAKEVISDDSEVRTKFLKHFGRDVESFSEEMTISFLNWRSLDDQFKGNKK